MKESFQLKEVFKVKPSAIYQAWLDSELHSQMTGGEAECSQQVGESFTAWDGYISGKNEAFIENEKIVQSWRTTEFPEKEEDSNLTIILTEIEESTELTLIHNNIPTGQTQYKQGWIDHYFEPMKVYFNQ